MTKKGSNSNPISIGCEKPVAFTRPRRRTMFVLRLVGCCCFFGGGRGEDDDVNFGGFRCGNQTISGPLSR